MSKVLEQQRHNSVIDLKVGAHVIFLDTGLYCVLHAPGQAEADGAGFPGVRISRAPSVKIEDVEISTFSPEGWLGANDNAALIRVNNGPAGVLVTTYQNPSSSHEAPRLQVMRLFSGQHGDGTQPQMVHPAVQGKKNENELKEISAHIQREGDVVKPIGTWVGTPGSGLWIEGFSISPMQDVGVEDIEYQAVLGKGWLSPWSDGGSFCGSRGMSLPILGMRIRLKGDTAKKMTLRLTGCFTDGTRLGPVAGVETMLESETLAPLEAFQLELVSVEGKKSPITTEKKTKKQMKRGDRSD
ncbi:hypothetical protein GT348_00675 [Aristophania vespae]|uniref:Hydrophobic W protein n=1 Tax=Aristophania vespae TaxID=2697033 RepID=A0A6P1NH85_9PROT|nr:hypothetical protein [Aristophania vespae]QHI95022.1 hypothetical protein GT348_00675 [Aristophania vespae]